MQCYKCNSKIAVVKWGVAEILFCLPCLYADAGQKAGKNIMPMTAEHLKWIAEGKKETTLRSLKYDKFPFEKVKVYIEEDNIHIVELINGTKYYEWFNKDDIVQSEGYSSFEFTGNGLEKKFTTFRALITALKKMRHKLPKEFWLYNLRKPLGDSA